MEKILTFTKDLPDSEGQFLISWKSKDIPKYELITVYLKAENWAWGLKWPAGFYISTWNHKHVSHINLDMVEGIAKL